MKILMFPSFSTLQKRAIFGGPSLQAPMVWSCGPARRHGASRPRWWSRGESFHGGGGWSLSHEMVDLPMKNCDLPIKMVKHGDLPIKNG